ncbi:MAG: response regulator transcription factor, partial [Melioribacteraceae bacterium]|nr:response regulator transcription factor [Melioribacteraceae bacterium]
MINIIIVDDHAIVREGLKQIVAEVSDINISGEASSYPELISLINNTQCSLVVMDINIPEKSGIEITKEITMQYPHIPVLILSMYSDEQYGVRAIKAGASGYLQKVSAPTDLITAIRKIYNGGKYISPLLADKLAEFMNTSKNNLPHEILSDREYTVMLKIAAGLSAEEIANELNISTNTVYSYRNRIFEKIHLKSNV